MNSVVEGFLSTSEVLDVFSDRRFLEAMLRFEASLARAQADLGVIPEAAALSIIGTCKIDLFDVARIVRESGHAGSLAIPLVRSLQEIVGLFNPDAVRWVHFGATSQDAIDTAMALVSSEALKHIRSDTRRCAQALLGLAEQYADTPVLVRTLMQPAAVSSFGLKCAGWAAPLVRSLQRLRVSADQALSLQLGGAAGILIEMGQQGPAVAARVAQDLGLRLPGSVWHTQRDEWLSLACDIGMLVGSLAKVATDVVLMSQFELGELAEPSEPGRGSATALPHKHNPVACMVALAAAQRTPQRVAALLACMAQEHERSPGKWQAELAEWPQLLISAHGSARAMALALEGLQVDAARMEANVAAVRQSQTPEVAQEWFGPGLTTHAAALARQQLAGLKAALG